NREFRAYLESLVKGRRVSHKVQNVDLLARVAPDKTARQVIEEVSGDNAHIPEMVSRLGMSRFLDSKLSSLSGGELQKVAVAAAMLRDADLYFFDEPSTYLDIYERMRVAEEISRLAEEKEVMVVEHDLAMLDYLADYAYVLYGEPGAYGVVSGIKAARAGINEFIEGYLKEENVRFRCEPLKFELYSVQESRLPVLFEYGSMSKSFGSFTLTVEGGEVRKGEVVGIVGPNAIGKSTFAKLVAGIEKPDAGQPVQGLSLSYKPQYISFDFDGTVGEYLSVEKVSSPYLKEFDLEPLMPKRVAELSGGEMQRLAVAVALSRDADLYILDEPSAFLDIEQRRRLATAIQRDIYDKEKAAFVIDHDVVFIDSISSRLMLFDGEPSLKG
ncbi:ATP-binding cassette domain-containing protein, partial [Candidatus Parcubacteria bacterium]